MDMHRKFRDFNAVWVEVSTDEHHGGVGWEFGTCLWSPVHNLAGANRYRVMEQPSRGDGVLHFRGGPRVDTALCGMSMIKRSAQRTTVSPPNAGQWGGREAYYRTELEQYQQFTTQLPLQTLLKDYSDVIRSEIEDDHPQFYPITTHGQSLRTIQGIYLARCTAKLYQVMMDALGLQSARDIESAGRQHELYQEQRRRVREAQQFARNPRLAADAKKRSGGRCELCGLDCIAVDSEFGMKMLECHHLAPLSNRSTANELTALDEVLAICANCHRLVHATNPPIAPDVLRKRLGVGLSQS